MIPKFRAWSPAPREVVRYLYKNIFITLMSLLVGCFRPLSREIGGYTNDRLNKNFERYLFPAPLEVNRLFK
ncbi:hypothetical protein HMPREF2766_02980 [Streptococcus sp. HMSC076C08]|nr:hypothetical protein HMPREF2766_02980 [Streptococcus sp. HMSC076C08]